MNFYSLERPKIPWGDYGDILHHGIAARDVVSGLLLLERTGNWVPPISFPGLPGVVISGEFRNRLEASGLSGFTFQPVVKHRIVDLDWKKWDPNDEEPRVYPETGEPEDYIFSLPHDETLSTQLISLWELVISQTARVTRTEDPTAVYGVRLALCRESWNGDDFFRAPEVLYEFVTENAKVWLEKEVGEFVAFQPW